MRYDRVNILNNSTDLLVEGMNCVLVNVVTCHNCQITEPFHVKTETKYTYFILRNLKFPCMAVTACIWIYQYIKADRYSQLYSIWNSGISKIQASQQKQKIKTPILKAVSLKIKATFHQFKVYFPKRSVPKKQYKWCNFILWKLHLKIKHFEN